MDLAESFRRLGPTGLGKAWPARRVGAADIWLARNLEGMPVLLLPFTEQGRALPTVELLHVRATFGLACELIVDNAAHEGRYSAIECRNATQELQHYFLTTCGAVLELLPPTPSASEVGTAIDRMVELFAAVDLPPRKTLEGLWGELALVATSRDPVGLVAAWHAEPEERFDFASGRDRLEVKTTQSSTRRHHFALEQLDVESRDILIVSILLEPTGGGESISDLVRNVSTRLSGNVSMQAKLFEIVASTLGKNWDVAASARFDLHLARKSVRFFDARKIPRVQTPLPADVSEVTFAAECADLPALDGDRLSEHGGLWASAQRG